MKSSGLLFSFISKLFMYIVSLCILYTIYIAVKNYYDDSYEVNLTIHNNREGY